jgi:ribose transport system substrate-binding protein
MNRNEVHRHFSKRLCNALCIAVVALGFLVHGTTDPAHAQGKKFKIYLSLSFSGDAWINEATNSIKALALTPPYDKMVDLQVSISGLDPQAQISAYESMIASGADAIISMPVSTTALNRTIRRGCDQGVKFFMFETTVTEPCAYNISTITSGFGENAAQALVNLLGGKGNIFVVRLIPALVADKRHYDGAMSVFKKYPGIKTVEYFGMATDETVLSETAKALAAHPDVDGIWSTAGESGAVKALLASGRQKLVPIVGESSNYFRLALANPELQKRGLRGVSSGGSPATAGYAFKLMMEVLTKQRVLTSHNIQYPLPWVPAEQVKVCTGEKFENGCNVFPKEKVGDNFFDEVFNPTLLPELTLVSVTQGKPTPGATIQKLPKDVVTAASDPGLNCDKCVAPADHYPVYKLKPLVMK